MEIDSEGFGLWHYWAESPKPCDLWSSIVGKLLPEGRNQRAVNGEHAWHRLALRGHLDAMRKWSDHFESPISGGVDLAGLAGHDSVVMRAAWSGNDDLVNWLIGQGADIHTADEHGLTPLMVAIHRCGPATVKSLLLNGADPEVADERGRTALHHAAQGERPEVYSLVEDCGGDVERRDMSGKTPQALLGMAARTPQQGFIVQSHWTIKYLSKLSF